MIGGKKIWLTEYDCQPDLYIHNKEEGVHFFVSTSSIMP